MSAYVRIYTILRQQILGRGSSKFLIKAYMKIWEWILLSCSQIHRAGWQRKTPSDYCHRCTNPWCRNRCHTTIRERAHHHYYHTDMALLKSDLTNSVVEIPTAFISAVIVGESRAAQNNASEDRRRSAGKREGRRCRKLWRWQNLDEWVWGDLLVAGKET